MGGGIAASESELTLLLVAKQRTKELGCLNDAVAALLEARTRAVDIMMGFLSSVARVRQSQSLRSHSKITFQRNTTEVNESTCA